MNDSLRALFRDRNFRFLFFGNMLSGVGQGMTIIGTPWYIARHYPSSGALGAIMTITIALSLVFGPYCGALIDRHKRKNLLLVENIAGFIGLGLMCAGGLFGEYPLASLGGIYLFTLIIFYVHFPVTYALAQESFAPELYGRISGILEVVTQTAAMVAGGATGYILESVGLPAIYAIDSATYAIAFFFIYAFRYEARVGVTSVRRNFTGEMRTALNYLRSRPRFTRMYVALFLPFIVLISLDLIHPFYFSKTMHAPASVFSLMNCFYAAGATAAGLWMRNFSDSYGEHFAYVVAFVVFMGALIGLALVPIPGMAFAMAAFIGWCNAGIRVNRITFVMQIVPPELIGRVNTFFNFAGSCMRVIILGFLTWGIDGLGAQWCYAIMAAFLGTALWVYASAKADMSPDITTV